MSQVLVARDGKNRLLLFQDLYFMQRRGSVLTTACEVACWICEKGIQDGVSVTAKKTGNKTRFFCQYHMSQE